MNEYLSLDVVLSFLPKIVVQLPVSLLIVGFSLFIGVVLGVALALARIAKVPVLSQIAVVFVSFIRGTPEIVQVFIVYYGVPLLVEGLTGVNIDGLPALYFVILAFGLNQSAYASELFRGALLAVPAGQYEAGAASGLTRWQTYWRIAIPQAAVFAMPGFGNQVVYMFQDTALAASLGVLDMMGKAMTLGSASGQQLNAYAAAAIPFVIISLVLALVFRFMSDRISNRR